MGVLIVQLDYCLGQQVFSNFEISRGVSGVVV